MMNASIPIPSTFSWPKPWIAIHDEYVVLNERNIFSKDDEVHHDSSPFDLLNDELHREMPVGHVLYGTETSVVAVCTTTHKDFVFTSGNLDRPFAIVHLTWSVEKDPKWPSTSVFASLDELKHELKQWGKSDFWFFP